MNFVKLLTLGAALSLLTACATTTSRSIQEMESHNGKLVLKYGEIVTKKTLFSTEFVSAEQKIADCDKVEGELKCSSLKVSIDNEPLVITK